ncbi:hypothetical protein PGT21_010606 [Puccinia graminis f. sp. tritici]|uniref:Uncharacterized protein n=1 Tax=Puccinia graminis f. sp. tritici TaxID=56615 RepID=A0A5B0LK53_PUCGR|nr:hypothetical protein PGT21_010606 [Puccinia graminis f. sp. tritici]
MSHTINQQHTATREALHPQQRGVSAHMPPPSRPASQQTARPFSTIVPPRINARETHPAPNPNPVYAPAHVSLAGHFQPPIGAAPVYPHGSPAVNYSIDAGLMGHPDGDRAQLAYEGNSQGNFEVQSDHHLNTGPPNRSDTIQYFVPEDGELILVSPDCSASPGRLSQARDILEVNHDTLQAMFRLSEANQHLARSILVMSEANIMVFLPINKLLLRPLHWIPTQPRIPLSAVVSQS